MGKTDIYLYGASGHGKVIKEIIECNGGTIKAFVDDNINVSRCADIDVIHNELPCSSIIVSIGNNTIRRKIVERLVSSNIEVEFEKAIHPSAIISPSATIGKGSVVMANAVINANSVIGEHCIINTGATVDHDCVIENFCHIAPGVHISGGVQIAEESWIGVGSSVIQCVKIGKKCMVGAGSVVITDIPNLCTAVGVPAKPIKFR